MKTYGKYQGNSMSTRPKPIGEQMTIKSKSPNPKPQPPKTGKPSNK